MENSTTWEWCYLTLIKGHEGPILAILILGIASIIIMAWRGWIRLGPAGAEDPIKKTANKWMSEETRRHLYQEDGMTKYITRSECFLSRHDCEGAVCKKIEELKGLISGQSGKLELAEADRNKELQKISRFMGTTDEFMESVKKEISDMRAAILMIAKDQRG